MKIHLILGASALTLGACAYELKPLPYELTPLPNVVAQEATTNIAISSQIRHQNPLAGYTYRGPTDPRDWLKVNQEQSESN